MSAVIFSGNEVKTLKAGIQLFTEAKILSGSVDPTSSATDAPPGSLYLNTSTSAVYKKNDSGSSTNWTLVPIAGGKQSYEASNVGIAATVAANALTVALKDAGGSDPSGGSPVTIGFRSATAATGQFVQRQATGALSLVVPDTATLGMGSGFTHHIWVYALDNAGTVELAVSCTRFDEGALQSTTALSTGADSGGVLYSTTSRSNVAIRLLGRITISEATAGTWASAPTEISLNPLDWVIGEDGVVLSNDNGFGSTNTAVRRYSVVQTIRSRSLFYTQDASNGDSVTITATGTYNVSSCVRFTGGNENCAVTVNDPTLANRQPYPGGIAAVSFDGLTGGVLMAGSRTLRLEAGSVLRVVTGSGSRTSSDAEPQHLSVMRVG